MAEEDEEVVAEETEAGGGKRKKLIIIAVAVVFLLAGFGGGAYWFLLPGVELEVVSEDGEVVDEAEVVPAPSSGKAFYHRLKPKFVTTFEANSRQRYVQLEVTLVTRDETVVPELKKHQPLIRNALVMLIGEQDYLVLQTAEGKAAMRQAAVTTVQNILEAEIGIPGIDQVLFTDFVMQ